MQDGRWVSLPTSGFDWTSQRGTVQVWRGSLKILQPVTAIQRSMHKGQEVLVLAIQRGVLHRRIGHVATVATVVDVHVKAIVIVKFVFTFVQNNISTKYLPRASCCCYEYIYFPRIMSTFSMWGGWVRGGILNQHTKGLKSDIRFTADRIFDSNIVHFWPRWFGTDRTAARSHQANRAIWWEEYVPNSITVSPKITTRRGTTSQSSTKSGCQSQHFEYIYLLSNGWWILVKPPP